MKLRRGIALLLASRVPVRHAGRSGQCRRSTAGTGSAGTDRGCRRNDIISVRIKASGELTYGADHKLEIQTTPADASTSAWSWAPAGRLPAM